MDEGLRIKIGADATDLSRGLDKAQKDLKDFGFTIDKVVGKKRFPSLFDLVDSSRAIREVKDFGFTIDKIVGKKFPSLFDLTTSKNVRKVVDEFGKIPPIAEDVAVSARKAKSELEAIGKATRPIVDVGNNLRKTAGSSNQAGIALANLGRIASDAPFGFIAIQNNLDPLIQSFGQLSRASGGVGGALEALAGSLLGAGGIALGFSVVSSLLTVAIQKYGSVGAAIQALTAGSDAYSQALLKVSAAQKEGNKEASTEIARLKVLQAVSADTTNSLSNRKDAANELLKTYKEYLPKLTQEELLNNKAADAINNATKAILNKALAQAAEKKLAEVGEQILNNELAKIDAVERYGRVKGKFDEEQLKAANKLKIVGQNANVGGVSSETKGLLTDAISVLGQLGKEGQNLEEQYNRLISVSTTYARLAGKAFIEDAKATKDANEEKRKALQILKEGLEQELKSVSNISDRYLDLEIAIANVGAELDKIGVKNKDTLDKIQKNLSESIQKIEAEFRANRFAAGGIDVTSLFSFDEEEAKKKARDLVKLFQTTGFEEALKTAGSVSGKIQILPSEKVIGQIGELDQLKKKVLEVTNAFDQFLTPVINTAFEALGNGASIFKAIGQSLKALVVQMGITIAKSAILAAILNSIGGGPALGIAGGGFGKIFSNLFKGSLGIGNTAAPNFSGVQGGGLAVTVGGQFNVRGTDLVAVVSQSNQRIGRVG